MGQYFYNYDEQYDIFYVGLTKYKNLIDCYSIQKENPDVNIYLKKSIKTKQIIGVEIEDFSNVKKNILKNIVPVKFKNFDFDKHIKNI